MRRIIYRKDRQMSESFITASFLSLSGGLQDAYTYILRGHVFANAQTGNIVLLAQCVCNADWEQSVHYTVPLLFFALGIAASELLRQRFKRARRMHWRQLVLAAEMALLFFVGFMPTSMNILANAMVSFACAMQVQAFRKVDGFAYASTMCIGDLRSGVESLCAWHKTHNEKLLRKAARYFGIIVMFAIGAGMGGQLVAVMGPRAVWVSCVLLLVSFALMFIREEIDEHEAARRESDAVLVDIRDIADMLADFGHHVEADVLGHIETRLHGSGEAGPTRQDDEAGRPSHK